MKKPTLLTGRIWVVKDAAGGLFNDVDTDMIFHNAHLAITDITKMGQHAFGNLKGWKDFATKAQPGDMILIGKNFGAGSSRQQAVDCFIALGTAAVIAESFAPIYKRNAINSGLPIISCPGLNEAVVKHGCVNGQVLSLDLHTGAIRDESGTVIAQAQPFYQVQMDIYQAGGLFEFGKQQAAS